MDPIKNDLQGEFQQKNARCLVKNTQEIMPYLPIRAQTHKKLRVPTLALQ